MCVGTCLEVDPAVLLRSDLVCLQGKRYTDLQETSRKLLLGPGSGLVP